MSCLNVKIYKKKVQELKVTISIVCTPLLYLDAGNEDTLYISRDDNSYTTMKIKSNTQYTIK